jgi:hypothetical protein
MEICLIKQTDARMEEADATTVRRFLFQAIDGCNDKDKKAWRSFWRAVGNAGSGEYFTITIKRQRSGPFHRLTFALLQAVFKGQERFDDFRIFRQFIKLGSGFVDFLPNADGELRAVPKSQSFDDCSEEEVRQFFDDAKTFLRTARAQRTLWPDATPRAAEHGIEAILNEFER